MTHLERFQNLLRDLFQFDVADLDFGLYRLLHLKRDEVDAFLKEQLPRQVDETFASVSATDQAHLRRRREEQAQKVREALGDEALTDSGRPDPAFAGTPVVKRYEALRQRLASIEGEQARKAEVFNHLYNFFSRYYEDGDFIPKRRYGARETYAVPYDGQEVFFHWANRDQHYVKTAETFKDYTFRVSGLAAEYHVRFVLAEASLPKDNTKGNDRYFFPCPAKAAYDPNARRFTVPFEYRPPAEDEMETYKKGNNAKKLDQTNILVKAADALLEKAPDEMLRAALAEDQRTEADLDAGKPELPLLLKRMIHFARRSTSDYFIHKDLRGFLWRELEFYIKDQVLHIEDIEGDFDSKRRMIRVLRRLGEQLIEFLAQIEDAQKRLFEKKKFVLRTDYLIPIQHVPREFWPEILENDAQVQQWKDWLAIDSKKDLFNASGKLNEKFLDLHRTLALDTRRFNRDFVERLTENLDDLENTTDALLINGENFQALRLLLEKYGGHVKCIHIDPPYNTQTSGFLYKNNYQHSSWLAMMDNRVAVSLHLLTTDGSYLCHIDENEYERLHLLFERYNIPSAGTVIWDKRNPMTAGRGVATQHEYVIWRSNTDKPINLHNNVIQMMLNKANELMEAHGGATEQARKGYADWVMKHPELGGGEKAYRFLDEEGRIYQSVSLRAPEPRTDPKFFQPLIHPVIGEPCPVPPNGFSRTPETLHSMVQRGEIIFGPDHKTQPRQKRFLTPESNKQISSVIQDAKRGKSDLDSLGLETFPYCHAVSFYVELLGAAASESTDMVLDFFAGSGTTGHAVINLNREDGGRRKFILVEMGEYFDSVLLPRIAKVMYTPEWKDGKPKRDATPEEAARTPRIVKILRLESYEDALHNVASDATQEGVAAREQAVRNIVGEDQYRLKYLVRLPLEASDTMLDVAKLEHPFDYTLEILTEDGPQEQTVDLMETFNWLYGLRVQKLATWVNNKDKTKKDEDGRVYRITKATDREQKRRILVVWRDMTDLNPETDREFLETRVKEMAEAGDVYDEMFINGDSAAAGFESLDGLFKRLMMAGEDETT